jgi:FAD dependent oxidoreductase
MSLAWLFLPALVAGLQTMNVDVLVYGATPAGISAAITAANSSNLIVALIEPTGYIGGMSGPGGIGLRDINQQAPVLQAGTVLDAWIKLNQAYYQSGSPVWQPDQSVGQYHWEYLVSQYKNIILYTNTALSEDRNVQLVLDGTVIKSITTVNTTTEDPASSIQWVASQFIDASYEADIVVASNMSFTFGRESKLAYNESLAGVQTPAETGKFTQFQEPVDPYWPNGTLIPGVDATLPPYEGGDDRLMPYSYRACMIKVSTGLSSPVPMPAGYNRDTFELLGRYTVSLNGPTLDKLVGLYEYNGYPANVTLPMKYDLCESGDSAVSTDEPSVLYTQYVTAKRAERKIIAQKIKNWVQGWIYFLQNDPQVPQATRNSALEWGFCKDAWPFTPEKGMPLLMYLREGVRIIGDVVSTQNNLVKGVCLQNGIGIASWTIDTHIMRRVVGTINGKVSALNEGEIGFAQLPGNGHVYELPATLLMPKRAEITNLLVPTSPSSTHISFSSIRVEPTFMQLGTAAGAIAKLAIANNNVPVQDLNNIDIQQAVIDAYQCIHWPECYSLTPKNCTS